MSLTRQQIAAGDLLRRISVNGNYLFVDNMTAFPKQEIEPNWFIQGGPNVSISRFGMKHVEGEISFPLLVNGSGAIDPACQVILENAHRPISPIYIMTNHVLSDLSITAEDGGTDNNELLTLDCIVVKSLTITSTPQEGVTIKATVVGTIDTRTPSDTVDEPTTGMEMRRVGFADCDISRVQSLMRSTVGLTVKIDNDIELMKFLVPYIADPLSIQSTTRNDMATAMGVKSVKWSGTYDEFTRFGASINDFMHGGWMVGENMNVNFGPVNALFTVPTFQISEQPLTSKIKQRKASFYATVSPVLSADSTGLFTFQLSSSSGASSSGSPSSNTGSSSGGSSSS